MILGISNIAWAPEERLAVYEMMARAEVRGLEIAPGLFFHMADDPFAPSEAQAKSALDEIDAQGLKLISMQSLLFGVKGAALFESAEARSRLEQGLRRAIDLAGRFGIPNVVFGSPGQRRVPDTMSMDTALKQAADVFRRLGDRAAQAGTVIAMEPNPRAYDTNFLNTLDEVLGFVKQVGHPQIACNLDLGAMHMNEDFDRTTELISLGCNQLNHVHVSEPHLAPAPANPDQAAQVLVALRSVGYDKAVSIEMRRHEPVADVIGEKLAALHSAARAASAK